MTSNLPCRTALAAIALSAAICGQNSLGYAWLANTADFIVEGTATSQSCRLENGGRTIRTHVVFEKLRAHKGNCGARLTVRLDGGAIDGMHVVNSRAPKLVTGRRYLLHLCGTDRDAATILGGRQGAFEIAERHGKAVMTDHRGREGIGLQDGRLVLAAPRRAARDTRQQPRPTAVPRSQWRDAAPLPTQTARPKTPALRELPTPPAAVNRGSAAPPAAPVNTRGSRNPRHPIVIQPNTDNGVRIAPAALIGASLKNQPKAGA